MWFQRLNHERVVWGAGAGCDLGHDLLDHWHCFLKEFVSMSWIEIMYCRPRSHCDSCHWSFQDLGVDSG